MSVWCVIEEEACPKVHVHVSPPIIADQHNLVTWDSYTQYCFFFQSNVYMSLFEQSFLNSLFFLWSYCNNLLFVVTVCYILLTV